MLLSEFAGNAELKYELSEIMKRGTLPHAIIIEGAEGTHNIAYARLKVKSLAEYATAV